MLFSARTAWKLDEDPFFAEVRSARARGEQLLDLTVSNPTACGFRYDFETLLAPLSHNAAARYEPEPLGMVQARSAVAAYYRDHGSDIPVSRICLTTSTSEAYSFLFRLLCDPGDEVLVASPSYPLFDYIARLDGVQLREYPLLYDPHQGWLTDLAALRSAVTERTRAVIVVHPNNPTGHLCAEHERDAIQALCAERNLTLIVDEVFLDFPLPGKTVRSFLSQPCPALMFVLSGISKVCGLPQMKSSWMAAAGPEAAVGAAMQRLEVVADTFLSMNAPVQHALPVWLATREEFQRQVRDRMAANVALLDEVLAGTECERLALDAGWSVILRVPRTVASVDFCFAALERGVIMQPGEFYGLPAGRAVMSLLTPTELLRQGVVALLDL